MLNVQELESRIERIPETGCWIWMGATTRAGPGRTEYAVLKRKGGDVRIHRALIGPLEVGAKACHRCGVSLCINPAHIYAGTTAQNNADTVRMGRHRCGKGSIPPIGEQHWAAKLTREDAEAIRRTQGTTVAIASQFGISRITVSRIRNGHLWK